MDIRLDNSTSELVENAARAQVRTRADICRMAFALYFYLFREWKKGTKIILQKGNGDMVEVIPFE